MYCTLGDCKIAILNCTSSHQFEAIILTTALVEKSGKWSSKYSQVCQGLGADRKVMAFTLTTMFLN